MATKNKKTIEMLTKAELVRMIEIQEAKLEALEDVVLKHLIDHQKHRGDNYGNRF